MRPLADVNLNFVESQDEAEECLQWLGEPREILGIDLETTGLRWWRPEFRLRLAQIGDVDTAWTFRVDRYGSLLEKVLRDYKGLMGGQNLVGYDCHVLLTQGFSLPDKRLVRDSRLMHELAYSDMHTHSLEMIIRQFVGREALEAKHLMDQAFEAHGLKPTSKKAEESERAWSEIPYECEAYNTYSGMDTISFCRGYLELQKRIDANFREAHERELSAWWVTFEHEHRGMPVDLEWANKYRDEMTRDIEIVLAHLSSMGVPEPTKRAKVIEKLQEDGWLPEVYSKKSLQPKLTKDILGGIDNEIVPWLMEYNRLTKWRTAYVDNVINNAYGGRVFPSIRPIGAKTGRQSASNPPVQQIPTKHEDSWKVKRMFLPEPGMKMVSIDYAAQENRLLYHFSKDPALKRIFDEGLDIHTYTAAAIYGVDYANVTATQRGTAKTFNYAAAYGAQDPKLAASLGVSVAEIAGIRDRVNGAFSGVAEYSRAIERNVTQQYQDTGKAFLTTTGGRRVYVDSKYGRIQMTQAVNAPNQGSGADIAKDAMNKIAAAGFTDNLMLFQHDEAICSVPPGSEGEEIADEIGRVMAFTDGEFSIDMPTARGPLTDYWGGH